MRARMLVRSMTFRELQNIAFPADALKLYEADQRSSSLLQNETATMEKIMTTMSGKFIRAN